MRSYLSDQGLKPGPGSESAESSRLGRGERLPQRLLMLQTSAALRALLSCPCSVLDRAACVGSLPLQSLPVGTAALGTRASGLGLPPHEKQAGAKAWSVWSGSSPKAEPPPTPTWNWPVCVAEQ